MCLESNVEMEKLTCFFGCIPLKKASLIIGIINLIICTAMFIYFCMWSGIKMSRLGLKDDKTKVFVPLIKGLFAAAITYGIMLIILSILFIIGVVQMNLTYITPYLWINFFNTLTAISICIGLASSAYFSSPEASCKIWGYVIEILITSVINIYFLIIVYYFYLELQETTHQKIDQNVEVTLPISNTLSNSSKVSLYEYFNIKKDFNANKQAVIYE